MTWAEATYKIISALAMWAFFSWLVWLTWRARK